MYYIDNKMIKDQDKQKIGQSAIYDGVIPLQSIAAFPLLNKRPQQVKRVQSHHKSMKAKLNQKAIKDENIRLIAKFMEISQRKFKVSKNDGRIIIKKRENPQRERKISLENQRLGRSLVFIKTGQPVSRLKTEMTKSTLRPSKSRRETQPSDSSKSNLYFEGYPERKQSISSSFTHCKKEKCINIDLLIELKSKDK